MEKALSKVGGLKVGSNWISKKTKDELFTITDDLYSSFSSTIEGKAKWVVNKLKGKTQKPLPELLRDFNLPAGLFPQNIICYEYDESRSKLIVYMSSPCEVCFKDSSILRYANRVKGTLSKGKLTGIEGMKTKVLMWAKVTSINVESSKSDKILFNAGVKKYRSKDAYELPRDAVKVEEF